MRNYRIIKVVYENNEEKFYVQRECRFLRKYILFGPKVWKTYVDEFFGPVSHCIEWRFNYKLCDGFEQLESAERIVKDLRQDESNRSRAKASSCEVIE